MRGKLRNEMTIPSKKKHILIIGKGSYIGERVKEYLAAADNEKYLVETIDAVGMVPVAKIFERYDVVFCVAGIAHIRETNENRHQFYEVNRDLVITIAKAVKEAGVGQFILLSSMSVYGKKTGHIKKSTVPYPDSAYGESKLAADEAIELLSDDNFNVAILRPPMVYGKECKGNYQILRCFALKLLVFPDYRNARSMIYIDNMCEFIKRIIDQESSGIFFPQDSEYVNTSNMVRLVAENNGKKIKATKIFNFFIKHIPSNVTKKIFGDLTYEKVDTVGIYSFSENIRRTERNRKKQALCIASVASNLDNFNRNNIDILQDLGYEVTIASNFHTEEDINSQEKIDAFAKEMRAKGVYIVQIDFTRNVRKISKQIKSIIQVRKLLKRKFDIIHCHSPICAAIVRREARKYRKYYGTKVVYTAHGFHFYAGASLKAWMLFYPTERLMSRHTDVLITINQEDYKWARRTFYAKKIIYIPGVGIDVKQFKGNSKCRNEKRKEMGLHDNDLMLLSVGELNDNKNHQLAIRAMAQLKEKGVGEFSHLHYFICGKGNLKGYLEKLIKTFGLENQVHLLGYREDVPDLLSCADIFLFLSKREGLPMALMEAMASGLPSIVTKIRGNKELIRNGEEGCVIEQNIDQLSEAIIKLVEDESMRIRFQVNARMRIDRFGIDNVNRRMRGIYSCL